VEKVLQAIAGAILEETELLLGPIVLAPALVFAIVGLIAIRARVENVRVR